jgi:hypothetical protein
MVFKAFEPVIPENEKAEVTEHDSTAPRADSPDNLLRGPSQIKLSVEFLDQTRKIAGIRDAVRYPASSAKFQIMGSDDPTLITSIRPTLYINVGSLFFKSDDMCVSPST